MNAAHTNRAGSSENATTEAAATSAAATAAVVKEDRLIFDPPFGPGPWPSTRDPIESHATARLFDISALVRRPLLLRYSHRPACRGRSSQASARLHDAQQPSFRAGNAAPRLRAP